MEWAKKFISIISSMPEGVFYKGMSHAPARAIVEQHHLSWFIDPVDNYEDEEENV